MYKQIYKPKTLEIGVRYKRKARIAQFMSSTGTNVMEILKQEKSMGDSCPYKTVAIVTDDKRSNAEKIWWAYANYANFIEFDIRDFMEEKGLGRKLTLATSQHQEAREEYTEGLEQRIRPLDIDFIVFGGFEPLTNIAAKYPCLNVHPGDLTYLKDGKPYLTGLHTVPIKRAIEEGIPFVRSSVIQAMPYTGKGEDMDNGPLLGLGPKLFYQDERDPKKIQDALKVVSDWKILPAVVLAVAKGEIEVDYEKNKAKKIVRMNNGVKILDVNLEV